VAVVGVVVGVAVVVVVTVGDVTIDVEEGSGVDIALTTVGTEEEEGSELRAW
jgi:hypothetical protein